jgi:hypothetical protein
MSRMQAECRKFLSIGCLVRLSISVRCFGMALAKNPKRPDRFVEAWSGARSIGERSPPPLCPRLPRPCRRTASVVEGLPPVPSTHSPRGTPPKASTSTPLLLSLSRLHCKSVHPLTKPSAPPAEGFSFFRAFRYNLLVCSFPCRNGNLCQARGKEHAARLKVCGRRSQRDQNA